MSRAGRPLVMPHEDRKKQIHAAAEKLFGERGYENVTMSEIAAEAGMSKKTLYVHFADKETLLKSFVASSYIWPERHPVEEAATDPVDGLKARLRTIADHVLSPRHLKLYRLAIGESIGIAGLADTFHEVGIRRSRESLIRAIDEIAPARRALQLESGVLADMLFGATIGQLLIDALLTGRRRNMRKIHASFEQVIGAMFVDAKSETKHKKQKGPV